MPGKWGSRWFLMSIILSAGAFYLALRTGNVMPFTAIGTTALGGGHLTNAYERRYGPTHPPDEDLP